MSEVEVNHKELEDTIRRYIKQGISLYIWGTTGIGKSQTVERIARQKAEELGKTFVIWHKLKQTEKKEVIDSPESYYVLVDKRLSQMDPSDLRGLPGMQGEVVDWKPPTWLKVLSNPKANGILFLDEINLAPPSLQASAYQIINDHAIDELSISEDVSIIAAGNRKEDKAHTFELPKPLQNRFGHCVLKVPHIDDWIDWAIKRGVDDRIIAFLKFRTAMLFKFDPKSKEKAFPTPRSWAEFCSPLIKDIPDKSESKRQLIKRLACTAVGSGTAIEFTSFLKLRDTIDFADIVKNPKKAGEIEELDMKYSLLSLVSEWYDKHYKKEDLKKVLEIADNMEDEFAILMLRMSKEKHKQSFKNNLQKIKLWKKLGTQYGKYLL